MTYTIITRSLRALVYPFKVIREGKGVFVFYALLHSCLTFYILKYAIRYTHLFLNRVVDDFPKTVELAQHLRSGIPSFCWIVLSPCIVTFAVVPVRLIWQKHKVSIMEAFELNIRLLRPFVRSIGAAFKASIVTLLPALGMLIIYRYYVRSIEASSLADVYIFACIVVGTVSIVRSLPFLLAPVITLCSRLDPLSSAFHARQILGHKVLELSSILLVTVGLRYLLQSNLVYFWGRVSFRHLEFVSLGIDVLMFWYAITGLTIVVLNAVQEASDKYEAAKTKEPSKPQENSASAVTRAWVN